MVSRHAHAKPWAWHPPFFVRSLPMGASKFSRRGFLLGAGDVVGIKVNPVGKARPGSSAVGSISNKEVLLEVVLRLRDAGVKPADIIVFERYANEFREAGYDKVMLERVMDGVRWLVSSS